MTRIERVAAAHPMWRWLSARGWTLVADDTLRGNGRCDLRNKRILLRPRVMRRPTVRHIRYVLVHEMWHAAHGETSAYDTGDLMRARGLDWRSAVEVVADAATLAGEPSRRMRAWVRASVAWHGRVGYRYRWSDVRSREAAYVVARLRSAIKETAHA